MRRILLTGASGTVGKEVLKQLCELPDSIEVTVFDRQTRYSKSFYRKFNNNIILFYGDISNKNDICKACKSIDVVIHLAAIIPPLADKNHELARAVNITGTKNLIECIEEQSPGAFFLYSSSISVYGDRTSSPFINTTDPLVPSERDEYAITKIEAEKLIRNSKLKWSIFRLTAIMGMDNHKPSELMFHMPLDSHLEIATPGDTGRAFVNSLVHLNKLDRKIFNLSGGEECRILYRDFITRSFEISGLGEPDFKENSFATKNFHCGYYNDGGKLNEIVDFRRESIDDYFNSMKKNISPFRRIITFLLRRIVKNRLQKKSEPLLALMTNNTNNINHYF